MALGAQKASQIRLQGRQAMIFSTQSASQSEKRHGNRHWARFRLAMKGQPSNYPCNAAAGTQDTDAVNVAQVERLAKRQVDSQQKSAGGCSNQ